MITTHCKKLTTYCKSFLNPVANAKLVELLPKKLFQSLIAIVTLLSYSTINFDKSYTCMALSKH